MDIPGLSLFQGAESLQLNNSTQQRIEEQDALEDQKRRNEEVKTHINSHLYEFSISETTLISVEK